MARNREATEPEAPTTATFDQPSEAQPPPEPVKAPAVEAQPPPRFIVAPGRTLRTSGRGALGPGEEVFAIDFANGDKAIATLVDGGFVIAQGA